MTLSTQHQKACRAKQIRQVYFIFKLGKSSNSQIKIFSFYPIPPHLFSCQWQARSKNDMQGNPKTSAADCRAAALQKRDTGLIARRCRKFLIEFFDLTAKNKHGQIGPPCIKQNTIYSNCPNYGCLWFGPISRSTRDKEVFCIGVSPEYWKRYKK